MVPPPGSAAGAQFQEGSGGPGAEGLAEEEGLGGRASGFGGPRGGGGGPAGDAERVDLGGARSH